MICKACAKESPATLCNICFLEELVEAIERGEEDPGKILQGMAAKYGQLRGLRRLPIYQEVFGKKFHKIRRVVTTEEGERCRIVPTFDGLVAITTGPEGQSAEGGRIVTIYEGSVPIETYRTRTSLIARRGRSKRAKRSTGSKAPPKDYSSPTGH